MGFLTPLGRAFRRAGSLLLTADGELTLSKVVKITGSGSVATISNIDAFWNGTNAAFGTATGGKVTLGRLGSGTGTAGRQVTVTFPAAYSASPYIAITAQHSGSVGNAYAYYLGFVTSSAFDIHLQVAPTTTGDDSLHFTWVVVG